MKDKKKKKSPDDIVVIGFKVTRAEKDRAKAVAEKNYQPLSWFVKKAFDEELKRHAE